VLNSLQTLLSYVAAGSEDCSSPVMIIANQGDYSNEEYAQVPTVAEVERTAREVGEYIGKQEEVNAEDVDVLVDILLCVSQMAFDTENALIVEDVEGKGIGNQDVSKFFENTLNFTKIFILQPMISSMREHDVNKNIIDFREICNTVLAMWSCTVENVSAAYEAANKRLSKVFDEVFTQG
jgi:hypothetical protein